MPSSLPHNDVRMIAIDIDGTLLPTGGRMVSARNSEALRAAEAAGVEIVIATGRRQGFAMPLLEPVGLARETILISSNGSITRNFAGELLERSLLPAETARDICGVLRPYGATVMTFDREGPGSLVIESFENLHRADCAVGGFEPLVPDGGYSAGECAGRWRGAGAGHGLRNDGGDAAGLRGIGRECAGGEHCSAPDRSIPSAICALWTCCRWVAQRARPWRGWPSGAGWSRGQVMAIGDNFQRRGNADYAGTGGGDGQLRSRGAERWRGAGLGDYGFE